MARSGPSFTGEAAGPAASSGPAQGRRLSGDAG